MTFQQELASWNPFVQSHEVGSVPEVGEQAPSAPHFEFPRSDQQPTVVAFLRHCGCPYAEKTFRLLRTAADQNSDSHFVAISHSDQSATSRWLQAVDGAGKVEVVVDNQCKIYGAYGLGLSSIWHNLNPWSLASVIKLGRSENIWNRPTESGSRWQTAGLFGISKDGTVKYAHVAQAADDLGNVDEALAAVQH